MFKLKPVDYAKLQSYWESYNKFISELEQKNNPNPYRMQRMKDIVAAIEFLFNDSSEDMQAIVQLNWWEGKNLDEVSAALYMPVSKIRRMQKCLLTDTADQIHWV